MGNRGGDGTIHLGNIGGIDVRIDDPDKLKGAVPLNQQKQPGKLSRTSIQESFLALKPEERQQVLAILGCKADGTGHIFRDGIEVTGQDVSDGGILLPGGRKER